MEDILDECVLECKLFIAAKYEGKEAPDYSAQTTNKTKNEPQ